MKRQPIYRVISPPREEFERLIPPLTAGEREVVEFFDRNLPIAWEIYIQPYLNGLRPDIVLLHPCAGIAVFEIKDWNLNAMSYEVNINNSGKPELWATNYKTGKRFSVEKNNPIKKAQDYKDEIINLYCPRINARLAPAIVTAGVIMTRAPQQQVNDLFEPFIQEAYQQYTPVVGMEAILKNEINTVFPESQRHYSQYMNEDLAADLRNWLTEPAFSGEQRIPLVLNNTQKHLATTRSKSGYRRVRGAAGSGKSMVIAARAAELAAQGKSVLVVSFNITLLHYLRSLAYRYQETPRHSKKSIVYLNFHYWCKRVCIENNYKDSYDALWASMFQSNQDNSEEILTQQLPQLVASIIDAEKRTDSIYLYDAVLVDEGQDYHLLWWQTLRKIVKPGGEMMLVHDSTQDIYNNATAWTEQAMTGCGFSGKWFELSSCYRLPNQLLSLARDFAYRYLPDGGNLPNFTEQESLDFHKCRLKWRQVSPQQVRETCLNEIFNIITKADQDSDLSMSDIVFLSTGKDFGYQIVCDLGQNGIRVAHTFGHDAHDSRRQKSYFFMNSPTIKVTTLHSFKGWEARAIVIYIDEKISKRSFPLIYAGLTRLKRHVKWSYLTVVCASSKLKSFGQTWDDYQEID